MAKWVDMKALREQVSMEDVLAHYELLDTLKRKGKSLVGRCPIHKGTSPSQFSVSLEKNLFNCFEGCGGGNVLDFVMKMEQADNRAAALMLQKWFSLESKPENPEPEEEATVAESGSTTASQGERENTPLTFALKNLDAEHPYLAEQGIRPETIQEFGIGFCSKGLMKGRIAIPIHNEHGELVAYAGRWPGDTGVPEGEGKYKLPPKFRKSSVLFNLHRARAYAREEGKLVVVTEVFDCIRLWQAEVKNVVTPVGNSLSEEQAALIFKAVGPQGRVLLRYGEDEVREECRDDALLRLRKQVYVKTITGRRA